MAVRSVNPTTGQTLQEFTVLSDTQLDEKLRIARDTFPVYRKTTFAERAGWMRRAADILETEKEKLGRVMTMEMGKTLAAAISEAQKCAWACRFYAENAERFMADEEVNTEAQRSFIRYQPIGPVLAIMPWNFPFWQVFRFAAPALMAGNVGLLKHASNVPQCALAIEDVFRRAGFPHGAFQTLLIGSDRVGAVIADPRVRAVTLTGSTPAGSQVAAQAGEHIKKTVLELGGSDPYVVMPSADLARAVQTAVAARAINNGQSCIAAKRFIVCREIAGEFERRFADGMRALKVGDPMDGATQVGPLATPDILKTVEVQVQDAVEHGAQVLVGGKRLDGPGNFYAPTVLTGISPDARAYHEEVFGPVASVFRVDGIDEAIRQANDTPFGLGSSVWTRDPEEQRRFTDEIQAGMVFFNAMVASDPRLPFGGVKESGYGRELSAFGIREFLNVKSVWIQEGAPSGSATE